MGCSITSGFHSVMSSMGRRHGASGEDYKQKLERKLYLARETPDPSFDLAECRLKAVPTGIFSLCKVFRKETLNLQGNLLTTLEDGGLLSDLYLLKVLNLNTNKFHKLNSEIRFLVNLRELFLSENQLKHLPDCIGDLVSLRTLDVSKNCLTNLPATLGKLKRLRKLSLCGNKDLKVLCVELCNATNIKLVQLDADNFSFPPTEVATQGTVEIMIYLCDSCGIRYIPPESTDNDSTTNNSPPLLSPLGNDRNLRGQFTNWEQEDENLHRLENEMHEAAKKQKEKFLLDYTREQTKMDSDLSKIQSDRDRDRSNLIQQIRDEEEFVEKVVSHLLEMNAANPQRIQQFLEHDQKEYDRLLEMCRNNYTILKTTDTLNAMQSLLEEECQYEKSLKLYGESQSEVKQSFLITELTSNEQLGGILKTRDELQFVLMERLLKDEAIQKAAVGALLEKCDARTWGLVQEITLVESHLARLSIIELGRKKLQLNDNMDSLADQRIKLSVLLIDLLGQQEMRRSQLIDTLQAMEQEKKTSPDFWLIRYQQLLESVPEVIVSSQQQLDPAFANYLLQEGVIHCLPFLVKFVSSKHELSTLTDGLLQEQGVRLSSDRSSVLNAIKFYLEDTEAEKRKIGSQIDADYHPTAPMRRESSGDSDFEVIEHPSKNESMDTSEPSSECVICMEKTCAVVFIPCGHLCCCVKCSDSVESLCPMCRGEIERRIRVIQA